VAKFAAADNRAWRISIPPAPGVHAKTCPISPLHGLFLFAPEKR
jgi:hypothetical protein